jgi:hypothetical protein
VKALAATAVTVKQRRQALGAYEDAMAAPGLGRPFKVKIDWSLRWPSIPNAGDCLRASGAL